MEQSGLKQVQEMEKPPREPSLSSTDGEVFRVQGDVSQASMEKHLGNRRRSVSGNDGSLSGSYVKKDTIYASFGLCFLIWIYFVFQLKYDFSYL